MTDTTYDEILTHALGLPAQDRARLVSDICESLGQSRSDIVSPPSSPRPGRPDPMPAMIWLNEHRAEYGGQWVALDGDRLIAHGPDSEAVFAAARADGAYLSLVTYIEPVDAPSFLF